MTGAGAWNYWLTDDGYAVGWLPIDDREEPTVVAVIGSMRDAKILRDVLDTLGAQPVQG